ncbi:hypothetical protein LX36DRAFT_423600 [Colletotrichum falcatum]|nr:hypothetical protein LX36DRAFT_423600 [Colletotrichum falcatum]
MFLRMGCSFLLLLSSSFLVQSLPSISPHDAGRVRALVPSSIPGCTFQDIPIQIPVCWDGWPVGVATDCPVPLGPLPVEPPPFQHVTGHQPTAMSAIHQAIFCHLPRLGVAILRPLRAVFVWCVDRPLSGGPFDTAPTSPAVPLHPLSAFLSSRCSVTRLGKDDALPDPFPFRLNRLPAADMSTSDD